MNKSITADDVLVVVDMQYDFMPGGALPVNEGNKFMDSLNMWINKFNNVVLTQDWHPSDHISFASSHHNKNVFDQIEVSYGKQELWPAHCVIGTAGARLHGDLLKDKAMMILRKGIKTNVDSYSAFFEKDGSSTGLCAFLKERGTKRVFVCGLATDFCVRYTAEDAVKCGFETLIIRDACRAVDVAGSLEAAKKSLKSLGVQDV